jgi:hypothetical protein
VSLRYRTQSMTNEVTEGHTLGVVNDDKVDVDRAAAILLRGSAPVCLVVPLDPVLEQLLILVQKFGVLGHTLQDVVELALGHIED